ncbi:inorganic phosphate transporter [Thermococcus sp.]
MMLIAAAFFMAWAVGANDSAKAVGTAVGSDVIGFKQAVLLISIFTTLGAVFGHSAVSGTVRGLAQGMNPPSVGVVLFSAAFTVTMASLRGIPISTTQSIIGGLIGASLRLALPVQWLIFGKIALAWVLSPLLAAIFAIMVYRIYSHILKRMHEIGTIELTQKWLVFISASFAAFNLGTNELSNVIGLSQALGFGGYFRVILALSLAFGALSFSYEVIMTVGRNISPLGPTSAFSSQFASSLAVSLANSFGLPVSSGQAVVGAVAGVGAHKGERINKRLLLGIMESWILAPLASGTLTYVLLSILP